MSAIADLDIMKTAGAFHAVSDILASAQPEHFGPEAQKLKHGYWGYRRIIEVADSVLEIQGKGQNARPFRADFGVYSDGKPTLITAEAYCDQCDAVIIHWRGFHAGTPATDLVGKCNSYPEHLSRERAWRYKIVGIR